MGPPLQQRDVERDSPVHRLDPRAKILIVLLFIATVVSTPPNHLAAYTAYMGLVCWSAALARVDLKQVFGRALAVLPFSILAALWLPWWKNGPVIELFGTGIQLSVPGLWLLLGVLLKSLLGAAALVLLSATTHFATLLCGLRKLGVPVILVDVLNLTYRYLFVLVDEAGRLRRAAAARGYRPRWLGQALLVGRLIGQLFLHAYERAERVHRAMLLRGYQGQMPAAEQLVWRPRDLAMVAVAVPLLLLVRGVL